MTIANPSIEFRVDLGITEPIMRCVAGVLQAIASNNQIDLTIEAAALRALTEIQRMSDKARQSHGNLFEGTHLVGIRIEADVYGDRHDRWHLEQSLAACRRRVAMLEASMFAHHPDTMQ